MEHLDAARVVVVLHQDAAVKGRDGDVHCGAEPAVELARPVLDTGCEAERPVGVEHLDAAVAATGRHDDAAVKGRDGDDGADNASGHRKVKVECPVGV